MRAPQRILSSIAAFAALLSVQVAAGNSSAYASSTPVSTPMRACTDLTASGCQQVIATIPAGATVSMVCWYDSSNYTGRYTSNRWFLIAYNGTGGWVHSSHVTSQTAVGWCGNGERYMAAWRAARWWGQVIANPTVTSWWTSSQWAPGPLGEWSGDCVKLGVAAYRAATGRQILTASSAYNQYVKFRDAGRVKGGIPVIGALVFYGKTPTNSAGHVAVYVGGGKVLTTQGLDNARKPNVFADYSTAAQGGAYLGWAVA